ncbi:MAG: MBL fold metallo-hydrolase [Actinophytocola sp.]|nr:MBL fold metallo-hydrolase [Actinophytocola sp.]
MVFKQYFLACLSHASYLVGDRSSGRAVVVDPQRDVSTYVADAEAAGLRIEWVLETHVHADFLSGHLELAKATGARIGYGSAADVDFDIERLDDGSRILLGEVELEILHTPGHTPESVCVLVRTRAGDDVPFGVLTGDTLFIGDVGRPDLLTSKGWSARDLARAQYRSLRDKLLTLPDETRVFPAHGAGSACGKNLSTETSSTIGEQRRGNYALAPMTEDEFVEAVTAGQSAAPAYFAYASIRNRQQRATLDEQQPVPVLSFDSFRATVAEGAVVLDTRDPDEFAAGHFPGAVNVGLAGRFAEMTGEVVNAADPIVLVCAGGTAIEARNRLARIGFDRVVGCLDGGVAAVPRTKLARTRRLGPREFAVGADQAQVVDVRGSLEISATGVIPGAIPIPLPELIDRHGELSPDRPVLVYCAGGYRSSIAASTLRSKGFGDVADLLGGFSAWEQAGLPGAAVDQRKPLRPDLQRRRSP